MEYLLNAFNGLNGIVWGAPMLALILGTGLFLMFLLKFMPLRKSALVLRCCGVDEQPMPMKMATLAHFKR